MNQPQLGVEPTPLPPSNLAAVFGRSDALRGKLQPVRAGRPAPTQPTATPPAAVPERPAEARPTTGGRRKPNRTAGATAVPADTPVRGVVVYLPVSLRERLRSRRAAEDVPFAEIVLDAVEATHERLGDLAAPPASTRSTLFVRSPRPKHDAEPNVQVYLRLNDQNLRVLDRLTQDHKAANRSALVAAALDAYLDKPN